MTVRGVLAGLVASIALACGCAPAADRPLELWAMGREGEVVAALLPAFARRHPEIRVRVQQVPWSAAHEKLLTAYVGGAMPDVFQAGTTWLPELAALDALEPLDARLPPGLRDDVFPGVWDVNVVGGRTVAVPWYVDTRLLFYRTDVLAEPPRTWAAWRDAMVRVKAAVGPERYAILLPLREWETPVILALARGATLLRDDDQWGNFRSAPVREAFAFYVDLFRRGLAPRTSAAQIANLYQDFAAGLFALYVSGPWNVGEFRARLPALAGRWATAPMPAPDGGYPYPGISVVGGASLAIHRGSARKDDAWKLVAFLAEPAQQVEFHRLTGDLPARVSAWTAPGLAGDPIAEAFRVQLGAVRAPPKIPEWERIAARISRYAEAAVRGDLAPDAALAALDADVDDILEKRRWLLARQGTGG